MLNFVGGWVGESCDEAEAINQALFRMGTPYAGETLWLYADQDPTFSLVHSKANFDAFRAAGGNASFHSAFSRPAGHGLANDSRLWANVVDAYLNRHCLPFAQIGPSPFPRLFPNPATQTNAFVSTWNGVWGGALQATLEISAVDAQGRLKGTYNFEGRPFRTDGIPIQDGVLRFGTEETGVTEFFVSRDGTIRGTWRDRATITLRRQ